MALCKLHAVWFHEPRAFTPGIPVYFGPYSSWLRDPNAQGRDVIINRQTKTEREGDRTEEEERGEGGRERGVVWQI